MSARLILHADMDAFYASIEQRDNRAYRAKPVIVGAKPGSRGVVSAASYEARTFGIRSAMPISQAYKRCPHGIYVRPRMSVYAAESGNVMEILQSFSPRVEQISIDEAFVDLSGTAKLWGNPKKTAQAISSAIQQKLHLTVSIGIAPNKFLAKIASDVNKPNGITITPFAPDEIIEWLAPLPVSRMWGVGKKTQPVFEKMGVHTIGDLQQLSSKHLTNMLGKQGRHLFDLCRGIDNRGLDMADGVKSISREHTFAADSYDKEQWRATLLGLCRDVAKRARSRAAKGATVVLTWRTTDFQRHSKQTTLSHHTNVAHKIYSESIKLLEPVAARINALRLIGVGITNLGDTVQTNLFSDEQEDACWQASESAMDSIARKFGDTAIFLGGETKANARGQKNARGKEDTD